MTLNGAQQQAPGESGQLQDPKGGEGNKPQDPKPGEGDPQEPKVDHKLEADNRHLPSYLHSVVYV